MEQARSTFWTTVGVAAGLAVVSALGVWLAWRSLNEPLPIGEQGAWVVVPSGTPLRKVTEDLGERGVLPRYWLLTAYARLSGDATRIRAGEYYLRPGATPVTLLGQLVAGQVYLHQFTIIEGWRFVDLLTALRAHPAIAAGSLDHDEIMTALGQPGIHPEGQFLPDTYRFPRGTSDLEVLRTAHQALQAKLDEVWAQRSPRLAVAEPYEALTLASIIEKETALPSERGLISGVFHERLRRGMRLQTDPTVIYGLGESFDGDLRRRDLVSDTPYNTYTRRGLPPTPIALPGKASLEAAVAPVDTDALYFVATGRGDGSHHFSATLEEHNRAVRQLVELGSRPIEGREEPNPSQQTAQSSETAQSPAPARSNEPPQSTEPPRSQERAPPPEPAR